MKKNNIFLIGTLFTMFLFMNGCFKTALLNKVTHINNKNTRRSSSYHSSSGSTVKKGKTRKVEDNNSNQTKQKQAKSFDINDERDKIKNSGDILVTFTDDYNEPKKDKKDFTTSDTIYAYLELKEDPYHAIRKMEDKLHPYKRGILYYQVRMKFNADQEYFQKGSYTKNHRNQRGIDNFKAYYSQKQFLIPIIPTKKYYETIRKKMGLKAALGQNYPISVPRFFNSLSEGKHIVYISFEFFAKTRKSYMLIKQIRGVFNIEVKSSDKSKLSTLENDLTQWLRGYGKMQDDEVATKEFNAEQEKLKKMSPDMRECYLTARDSKFGYLACYKGPIKKITFRNVDANPRNGSRSTIYVIWKDYKGKKTPQYSGGREGIACPYKGSSVTIPVPIGAKVIRGSKTFFRKVTRRSKSSVYLRWYHDK